MNSIEKGKRGERELAKKLRERGFDKARRGQQYHGLEGEDVVGLPLLHIEVTLKERVNIYDKIAQASNDADENKKPAVIHRKKHKGWLVTSKLDDYLDMYEAWLEKKEEKGSL